LSGIEGNLAAYEAVLQESDNKPDALSALALSGAPLVRQPMPDTTLAAAA